MPRSMYGAVTSGAFSTTPRSCAMPCSYRCCSSSCTALSYCARASPLMRACSVIVNERSSTESKRAVRDFVGADRDLPLSASRAEVGALSALARVPAPAEAARAAASSDTAILSFTSEDHIARLHHRLAYLAWVRRRVARRCLLRRAGGLRPRLRRAPAHAPARPRVCIE